MMKRILRLLLPPKVERPEAAYDRVLVEKRGHYRELKSVVAKVLFLRNKLEGELFERRAEVARIHDEARRAVRQNDDARAMALLDRMRRAKERVRSAEEELSEVRAEAASIKEDLEQLSEVIAGLERERAEAIAKLRSAEAREELRRLLSTGHEVTDSGLEAARALVARTSAEASLDRELSASRVDIELADAGARIELARLKASLLPA